MSFRLIRLHDYAELLAENPKGRLVFIKAVSTNATYHPETESAEELAEFLLICDEVLRDERHCHGDDVAQLRTAGESAAKRLALLVVAKERSAPRPA